MFAEVAVLMPVPGTYHYKVPERLRNRELVGSRVLVPFGNRGVTGVIVEVMASPPKGVARILAITTLLDRGPLVSRELLRLCAWIADYYEAPLGEVVRAALPAGSQVSATRLLEITEEGRESFVSGGAMSRKKRDILGVLSQASTPMAQAQIPCSGVRTVDIAALVEDGLIRYVEDVGRARVEARTERMARLVRGPSDEERVRLERSPKKSAVLAALEGADGYASVVELAQSEPRAASHLRTLAKWGVVAFEEREAAPGIANLGDTVDVHAPQVAPPLNDQQQAALDGIRLGIREGRFNAYLLHGITGSGKTEIYLNAIAEVLDAGQTAIVLVPEISLTPQLAARFRARFGDRVAVLHSGLTDRQRFDEWQRLSQGSARIALGARSAVFAPVENLGVMVVDEEHDSSFKQDEGVRYHARDVALVRAQRANAICVLGSATPSLESFHAALSGRYHLLTLPDRATARPLPEVELIDLRVYKPDSEAMLTAPLAQGITETLERGEQIILFLNRRGFDTFVLCRACGYAFRCTQCSVSLTYHRYNDQLLCHYCGYHQGIPETCPSCGHKGAITRRGLGTEKVESALVERFPDAHVGRLDRDITSVSRISKVLARFARREIDILVGTQMVTKGHDFPNVTLVGVLCADTGLSLPDFRAAERTFQLLTQVAGRAGRGERPGRVLIQSYRPDLDAVKAAAAHDYEAFFQSESAARQELGYPPFGYLVAVRVDGPDGRAVANTARHLASRARSLVPERRANELAILGPCEAPLARLKGRTRWHVWLRGNDRKELRLLVRRAIGPATGRTRGVRVSVDVDPISAL